MPFYIFKRILGMIPVLLIIITVTFFLMRQAKGGPFDSEKNVPEIVRINQNKKYHLDKPLHIQYYYYMKDVLRGDLGMSLKYQDKTVREMIGKSFPVSLSIGFFAMIIALTMGTFLGFIAALKHNTIADYSLMSFAIIGISVPNIVLGPILAVVFGVHLGWLPVAGWGDVKFVLVFIPIIGWEELKYYVLPVLTLTFYYMAIISRIARGSMLEMIRQDFIQTARSKGLDEKTVVFRHALKGAMLPIVTYCGPASAFIITGSIVIEQIFAIPGVGRYFVQGAIDRDYTLVMGTVILVSLLVMTFNMLVDVAYCFLDPRIKLHEK